VPEHRDAHGDFDDMAGPPGPFAGPGPHDPEEPLRALFKSAAADGQARTRSAPPAEVRARGAARRRRRAAVAAAALSVVLAGTAAGLVSALPRGGDPVQPGSSSSGDGKTAPAPGTASGGPVRGADPTGTTLPPPSTTTSVRGTGTADGATGLPTFAPSSPARGAPSYPRATAP
jgi:hypothetical protein